ncbi:hypothetical protein MMC30_009341, partial [Trapelia coarctata]|nr:hypothetical protein [Trapelia coarctata]
TPIEETMEAIQSLYTDEDFKKFGLSNFSSAEVQEIYDLASSKKYVLPTIHQGNYNPISRHIELDLIPLLRKLKISFIVNSPLAGGFLAKSAEQLKGDMKGRWNKDTEVRRLYRRLYDKPSLVAALEKWGSAAEEAGTTRAALAYRWVLYHSALEASCGDGMIIGASSVKQVQQTLDCVREGPIPKSVLPKIDEIWELVKEDAPVDNYHG